MTGTVLSAGQAAAVLFGTFIALLIARVPVAFALGLACLPILLIEPRHVDEAELRGGQLNPHCAVNRLLTLWE